MKMHSEVVSVQTRDILEFVDITPQMGMVIRRSGILEGLILVRSRHTTAAITCTESDPDVHQDCRELLDDLIPVKRAYHHSYEGKVNARAHQAEMLGFGHATWACVRGGKLDLGTWQRIYLIELFRPMARRIDCVVIGE
jgi:secondary thiamine-phosphate synthase enzyme